MRKKGDLCGRGRSFEVCGNPGTGDVASTPFALIDAFTLENKKPINVCTMEIAEESRASEALLSRPTSVKVHPDGTGA